MDTHKNYTTQLCALLQNKHIQHNTSSSANTLNTYAHCYHPVQTHFTHTHTVITPCKHTSHIRTLLSPRANTLNTYAHCYHPVQTHIRTLLSPRANTLNTYAHCYHPGIYGQTTLAVVELLAQWSDCMATEATLDHIYATGCGG